jgi:hypothetical protein
MIKLPTIAEIVSSELTEREKGNALNVLLNQSPPPSWLKKQNGVTHLPVDKVRFLLNKIFIDWNQEIKAVQPIANSVVVTVTLNYLDPISNTWKQMDGIGAAPINTKKEAGAMEWDKVIHDSVHKCVGAAASFALKNAAKNLGRIFGSDLMNDDSISYDGLIDPEKFKNATLTEK